jgi:hypothetical protein
MRIRHATCGCGQLRLTCEGEPVRVSVCHCLECQRRTGSAFGVQARFRRERVTRIEGRAAQFSRVAESDKRIDFHFCPACGSTVYWEAEAVPDLIAVAVGAFADPDFPPPEISVWERRRHSWAVMPEDQPVQHSD